MHPYYFKRADRLNRERLERRAIRSVVSWGDVIEKPVQSVPVKAAGAPADSVIAVNDTIDKLRAFGIFG